MGLVRRLGVDAKDAEDVAQEVFLVAYRRLPDFEGRSSLKTWLCGIALRVVGNYRRTRRRRPEHPLTNDDPPMSLTTPGPNPEQELMQQRNAAWLERGIERLPTSQRSVFVLFELEDLSMQEVAKLVGCPLSTAYGRLYEARATLRAHFIRLHGAPP